MAFRTIGLEIGTSALRAAELLIGGEVPSLSNYQEVQLPPKAIVDGEIADKSIVIERLKRLWDEGDFSQNRVTVGVAGLRAIIREVDAPYVPDKELDQSIQFVAQDVIPFPPEKTLLSYKLIGDVTSPEGTPKRRCLVAAAHRDLVDPIIEVLDIVGLVPNIIDLSSLALVRIALTSMDPLPSPGAEALVSIGAGLTMVVVHENGIATFVRTIGLGGDAVTEAIASVLDSPFQDAEQIKWNLTLPGPQYQVANNAARETTASLITEIRSSVEYYNSIQNRQDVQRVVVTGGGSLLNELIPRLQQQFRIPVTPLHPLRKIDTSQLELLPEDIARREPSMSTVLGLAVPEPGAVKQINLLPPEIKRKESIKKTKRLSISIAVILIAIMVALSVLKFLQANNAANVLSSDNNRISSLNQQIAAHNQAAKQQQQLQQFVTAAKVILAADIDWQQVTNELDLDMPAGGYYGAPTTTPPTGPYFYTFQFSPYKSPSSSAGVSSPASKIPVLYTIQVPVYGGPGTNNQLVQNFINAITNDPLSYFTQPQITAVQELSSSTGASTFVNGPISFNATFGVTSKALAPRDQYYTSTT
jgi:type IV pilus assembly protein PilM